LGVQLDPTPLITTADPDYRAIYEAVVDRAAVYHERMYEGG
jgi:hypothetical protein